MIECLCFSPLTFGYLPTNMMKFLMYQENVTLSRSSILYILYFEVMLKIQDQVYAIGNEFCCWYYIWTWKYPFKKNRHLDIIFQLYQELVIVPTGFRL